MTRSNNTRQKEIIMNKTFIKEINSYSIDELQLIVSTQQDLYSEEEMSYIKNHLDIKKDNFIKSHIPKEIPCQKCGGANDFNQTECSFCSVKLNKDKYYNIDYYKSQDDTEETEYNENESQSYTFQFIMSLIIPIIGFIIGGIMIADSDEDRVSAGKTCIVLAIVSLVIGGIILAVMK